MNEPDYSVCEHWRLRNGSTAQIHQRDKGIAVGVVDNSGAVHTWVWGKTSAGRGYDLIEQLQEKPEVKP